MAERKTIPPKLRLRVLKRDRYTCQICGKSPAIYPEIELEVDHVIPVSKGGDNSIENLQTLCFQCNRGKGNDQELNFTLRNKLEILFDKINPQINIEIKNSSRAVVIANESDFSEMVRLNKLCNAFDIKVFPNTIQGYKAGFGMGIYTIEDNYGSKVHFSISIKSG